MEKKKESYSEGLQVSRKKKKETETEMDFKQPVGISTLEAGFLKRLNTPISCYLRIEFKDPWKSYS